MKTSKKPKIYFLEKKGVEDAIKKSLKCSKGLERHMGVCVYVFRFRV